jgi:hypothetical protein
MGKGHKLRQGLWENNGVVVVDRFDRDRTEDEAVIVNDRQLFFPFLMFMAGVADALAPFLTTVLEPSPWRTDVSSCAVSWRWMTDASKRA